MRDVSIQLANGSGLYHTLTDDETNQLLEQWVRPKFEDIDPGHLAVVHLHIEDGHRITVRHDAIESVVDIDSQRAREIEDARMLEQQRQFDELMALRRAEVENEPHTS